MSSHRRSFFRSIIIFVQVIALAVVLAIAHGGAGAKADGSINITGTVTDQSNARIAGVSVYATDPGTSTVDFGPVSTGQGGTYTLQVSAGTYDFHFDPPAGGGFQAITESNITVLNDQVIDVQLTPQTNTLSGIFTDASGNPIVNANVELNNGTDKTRTDTNGQYSFSLPAAKYALDMDNSFGNLSNYFLHQNFSNPTIDLTQGNVTLNLQLPDTTVHVMVKDASGNPLSGVPVSTQSNSGTASLYSGDPGELVTQTTGNATTDSSGNADLTSLVGASYGTTSPNSICATIGGSPVCLSTPLTVAGETTVVLQQPVTNTLSGTFTSADGTPLANADVELNNGTDKTRTDASGHYSFSLAPAEYTLDMDNSFGNLSNYFLHQSLSNPTIDLTQGNVTLNLQLPDTTVHVTVEDANGNPLANVPVSAQSNSGTASLYSGDPGELVSGTSNDPIDTNASGQVDLVSLIGASYGTTSPNSICATISGSPVCLATSLTVGGETSVVLQQPVVHTLSGTFTDASGTPIANANIELNNGADKTRTDASGRYSFSLPPAEYTLDMDNSFGNLSNYFLHQNLSNPTIDLTNGDLTLNLQLPNTTVHVTVKDATGSPLSNIPVSMQANTGTASLYSGDPGELVSSTMSGATTDVSGNADLTSLVGATYGTDPSNSICVTIGEVPSCLTSSLTLSGHTTIVFEQGQAPVVTTIPPAPTNLSAVSPTGTPLLTWDAVSTATSYNIYRDGNLIDTSTTNSYTDHSTTPATYTYFVTAVNSAGESGPSNTISVVVQSLPSVTGTVTNQQNVGVSGVSVYATAPGGSTVLYGPVSTASDGSYALSVAAGTYDFHYDPPSGSGLRSIVDNSVTVLSDRTINVQFAASSFTFSGTLTDQNGNPISGVQVTLQRANSVCTDANGHFSITAAPGSYTPEVSGANSFCSLPSVFTSSGVREFDLVGNTPIDLTTGNVTQNMQLPLAHLTVTFSDASGTPISGASILYEPYAGSTTLFPGETAQGSSNALTGVTNTDSTGTAHVLAFSGLTFAQSRGQMSLTQDNLCARGEPGNTPTACIPAPLTVTGDATINLVAPATHVFSGTLTDQNGNPLPSVQINLQGANSVCTNASGAFSIPVAPGSYIPEVSAASFACGVSAPFSTAGVREFDLIGTNPIDLTSGNVTQNIQLQLSHITVVYQDASGNPISGANVLYEPYAGSTTLFAGEAAQGSSNALTGVATTDTTGTAHILVFSGLTFAQSRGQTALTQDNLCARGEPGNTPITCIAAPLTASGDQTITLVATPMANTFSGTLTDQNGNPISGVQVALQGGNSVCTDTNGNFSIPVAPGSYIPEVSGSTSFCSLPSVFTSSGVREFDLIGTIPVDLTGGNVSQNMQLQLSHLTVTFKDAGGNPISGANLIYEPYAGSTTLFAGETAQGSSNALNGVSTTDATGTAQALVFTGLTFAQSRGQTSLTQDNLCMRGEPGNTPTACLAAPLTVTGDASFVIQLQPPVPAAPTNLTAASPTATPVLNWNAVSGATSYNVYRDGSVIGTSTTNTFTDSSARTGTYDYFVTAVNSAGESTASNTVTVTVGVVPAITSASSATTGMRVPFSFTVTTTGNPTPSLTESGVLPNGITFTDNGDGTATVSGEAAAGTAGTYPITIDAGNGIGADATQTFTLTVTTAVSTPAITSLNNDTETVGVPFSFTVTTDGFPVPTLSKSGVLPTGITFTDNGDGTATIAGTPGNAFLGTKTVTLKAKNSVTTATQTFTLTITQAPVLHPIQNKTTAVGTPFSLTITSKGNLTPVMTESGALPNGITFTDNGDGTATIAGTAQPGSGAAYSITVTATNPLGSSSQTFKLNVDEGPVITSQSSATATVGNTFSFTVAATGYPSPTIARTGALPKGLTWKGSTATLSGTPAANTAGTYPITFTAKNGTGTISQTFTLTVH